MSSTKQPTVTSSTMTQGRRSLTPSFVRSRRSHLLYRGTPVPLKGFSPSPTLSVSPATPGDPLGDLTLEFEQKCHVTSTPGCEKVTVPVGRTSRRQRSTPTIAENDVASEDVVGGGGGKHQQQNSATGDERIVCKFKDNRTLKQMRFASLPVNCHLVHDIFSRDKKVTIKYIPFTGDAEPNDIDTTFTAAAVERDVTSHRDNSQDSQTVVDPLCRALEYLEVDAGKETGDTLSETGTDSSSDTCVKSFGRDADLKRVDSRAEMKVLRANKKRLKKLRLF